MSFQFIRDDLSNQKALSRFRTVTTAASLTSGTISVDGKEYINFSSNDYLGLNNHPAIIKALNEGAEKYGVSASASNLVTGNNYAHQALEETVAAWLNKQRVLLFTSGFAANQAVMQSLGKKESVILMDKLSHASMIDGALASEATVKRFLHNDYQQASVLANKYTDKDLLVASEAVFSMDGDTSDAREIASIAKAHQGLSFLDEAHSIGVFGDEGQGSSNQDIDIVMATLGKAIATSGAFVACNEELYQYFVNFARHYIYSTAMSPAVAWATKKSIEIIQQESWRRARIKSLSSMFRALLDDSVELLPTSSAIHAINVQQEDKALAISEQLKAKGIWLTAIRPPTVAKGTSRLRVTICANHNDNNIKYLAKCLNEVLV